MADFYTAYAKMLKNEGGYKLTNVKGDRGKMTFAGISRRFHPEWSGWLMVDAGDRDSNALRTSVANFYIRKFWRPIRASKIEDQSIAEDIFDFGVNANWDTSARLAQAAVGVHVDGQIGAQTLAALNAVSHDSFSTRFFIAKITFYAGICNRDRTQDRFLLGWINRSLKHLKNKIKKVTKR